MSDGYDPLARERRELRADNLAKMGPEDRDPVLRRRREAEENPLTPEEIAALRQTLRLGTNPDMRRAIEQGKDPITGQTRDESEGAGPGVREVAEVYGGGKVPPPEKVDVDRLADAITGVFARGKAERADIHEERRETFRKLAALVRDDPSDDLDGEVLYLCGAAEARRVQRSMQHFGARWRAGFVATIQRLLDDGEA